MKNNAYSWWMKKIFLLVVVVVAGVAGYIAYSRSSLPLSVKEAIKAPAIIAVPGLDKFESLPSSAFLITYIQGSELLSAANTVTGYLEKIQQTQVWKGLGIDAQITNVQQQLAGQSGDLFSSLQGVWKVLEGGFDYATKTIQTKDNTVTAVSTIVLKTPEQRQLLSSAFQEVIRKSTAVIDAQPNGDFTARFGVAPQDAVITAKSSEETTLVITALLSGIESTPTLDPAPTSQDWHSVVAQAGLENTTSYFVVKQDEFRKIFPAVLKRLSEGLLPELAPSVPAIVAKLENSKETGMVATVTSFRPTVRIKTCSTTPATSSPTESSTASQSALQFVGSRTPGLLAVSTSHVLSYLETMLQATASTPIAASSADAQSGDSALAAQSAKDLSALKQALTELHLKEVVLVSTIPISGVTPYYGFAFVSSEPVPLKSFGEKISAGLATLKERYTNDSIPTLTQSTENTLGLDVGNGTVLEGRSLNSTTILFTENPPLFDEMADVLKKDKPFISTERIKVSNLSEITQSPALLAYVSTSSLMPLARQFAPFLSMLNPEAKLTDQDYNAFLSLVEFNALYSESAPTVEKGITCSLSGLGLLKKTEESVEVK